MCHINRGSYHAACGHGRTSALVVRQCDESLQTGHRCPVPAPLPYTNSTCWKCLHERIGSDKFTKHVVDKLGMQPWELEISVRDEEYWIDAHRKEREERKRAKSIEQAKVAAAAAE